MPINKKEYHRNFDERSDKITQQPCAICGNFRGGWCITVNEKLDTVAIQAHHPNHDPWNGKAKLMPLCEQCHLKIDAWYRGKRTSYTLKGKKYEKMKEAGQQEIVLRFSKKGRETDLAALLLVDNEWMIQKLIAHLKAELNKPKRVKRRSEAEQLSLLLENEETAYTIIEVDFPVSQFLQAVPLTQ